MKRLCMALALLFGCTVFANVASAQVEVTWTTGFPKTGKTSATVAVAGKVADFKTLKITKVYVYVYLNGAKEPLLPAKELPVDQTKGLWGDQTNGTEITASRADADIAIWVKAYRNDDTADPAIPYVATGTAKSAK